MKKLYLGIVLPFCLYSQDLNQLVDASMQNQLIDSSKYNIESIKSQYKSIQNSYMPKLTIGANYSNTNKETASMPNSSFTSFANINYVVYDGEKKESTYKSFESSIKSANKNLESLKNNITLQVINYYFNYQSLISSKIAKQKEIEQLNAQYTRLVQFLEAGTTTSDEVQKIISRVENANVTLHEIELNIQTILHNLEYLTANEVIITDGSTIKSIQLKEESLRADIKAMEYDMKQLLANARTTKSANMPMISLDNTLNYYDFNYDNEMYQNSAIDSQNIFKFNFSWKLYDFDSTNNAYKSAYKKYQALKSNYEYEKNKASVDLKLTIKSYDIAKLKISSAKAGLKAANSTYETIEQKYHNGLVDNVSYLEALSEKYNAISILKSAKFDLEIKKANIIYHSGKNLQEYIK
ncbi:MAG: TolC family protein [Campylobacterota bacterium]|nr:TolC family protein [Campylobacterota bacterium]